MSLQASAESSTENSQEEASAASASWLCSIAKAVRRFTDNLNARFPLSFLLKIAVIVLALSWYAFLSANLSSINDLDLGWHLRSGEWIVQNHQLPRTDPFSVTGATKPWVAYSWPFSVLIFEVASHFDLLGIAYFELFSWMAIVTALFLLARRQGASIWRAAFLTLIAGRVLQEVVAPRPGVITMLCFITLLIVLLKERKRPGAALWAVPFLMWVWSNVHIQFVYGLFVMGLFCAEPLMDRLFLGVEKAHSWSRRLWIVFALSVGVTFVNPYGVGPYRVILDFLRQPLMARLVTETTPVSFTDPGNYIVLVFTLAVAGVMGRRKLLEPLWMVLFLWAAIFSFRMERDVWVVSIIALAYLASSPLTDELKRPREDRRIWLYASIGIVLVILITMQRQPRSKEMLGLMARDMPVGAVAYIHQNHLQGPIFNDYDWGGFLIYALPEYPVAIDGRTNIHDQDEVARSINTWSLLPGWSSDPLLRQANLVIGSPKKPLTNHLAKDAHFKIVYYDRTCVLFQRVGAAPN